MQKIYSPTKNINNLKPETHCSSEEVSMKSFFLGPHAENKNWVQDQVQDIISAWASHREQLFLEDGISISASDQNNDGYIQQKVKLHSALMNIQNRFSEEIPKHSPRYIGHMLSEISLPALFGHITALLYNPNNISKESSWVGVQIEEEALSALYQLIGYEISSAKGHFTSGGTVANFEALIRAKARCSLWIAAALYKFKMQNQSHFNLFEASTMGWDLFEEIKNQFQNEPDWIDFIELHSFHKSDPWIFNLNFKKLTGFDFTSPVILIPSHKHYSWTKGVQIFGLGMQNLISLELDYQGKLDTAHLEATLCEIKQSQKPFLMMVSVLGTTELGQIDPIYRIQNIITQFITHQHHLWHHIDAAYGGFWLATQKKSDTVTNPSLKNGWSDSTQLDFAAVSDCDSLTIDPHKLAYVPYASGAILIKNPNDYFVNSFTAPYVQYTSQSDRGPYTLEGSRSAAGALATLLSHQTIGFNDQGLGRILNRSLHIRKELETLLKTKDSQIFIAPHTEGNVLGLHIAFPGEKLSDSNLRNEQIYVDHTQKQSSFFFSKTQLSLKSYNKYISDFCNQWSGVVDADHITLVRIVLMNPFIKTKEMNTDLLQELVTELKKYSIKTN